MTFGVTPQGFNRMLESDIKGEIVGEIAPVFGVDPTTRDWPNTNSIVSQFIDAFCRRLGIAWEFLEALSQGIDPAQASGTMLDGLLAFNNINRLEASSTEVLAAVSGTEGTEVPVGTLVSVLETGAQFEAAASVTITKASLLRFEIQVAGVSDIGTPYTVTINGNVIDSGAVGGSPTRDSIAYLLLTALNASVLVNTAVEAVFYGVATVQVSSVDNLTVYSVTIDGEVYSYTSSAAATNLEIVEGLVLAVNNGQSNLTALALTTTTFSLTHRNAGADWSLVLSARLAISALDPVGAFAVKAADLQTAFSGDVDSRMDIDALFTPQTYTAVETGPVEAPAGALTNIVQQVPGFSAVTNFLDGELGSDVQSDDDARILREQTLAIGTGHSDAIRSQLFRNVEGMTVARVYENILDTEDAEGRPGHSVEVLAVGGLDADIAQVVWDMRASGITPYGNINADGTVDPDGSGTGITIKDSNGADQVIHFSRPEPQYAFIQCVKSLYSEEDFPEEGDTAIADALLAFGLTMGIGNNFLIQRFIGPAVSVPGVGGVTLQIAISDDPDDASPTYGTANIAISPRQLLVFDSSRIFVT